MKKFCALLTLVLALGVLPGCSSKAPALSEIYDRVVELVEASYEMNEIFYGDGLPYYDRELSIYSSMYSDFATEGYTKDYNIVSDLAKFHSVEEIKLAAEQVYSRELLEEVVYPSAFTGLLVSGASGSQYVNARYVQSDTDFYIYAGESGLNAPTPLVYDYASMQIVRPSNGERVLVSMTAWEEDSPESPTAVTLTLTRSEDGVWLLDSLTV